MRVRCVGNSAKEIFRRTVLLHTNPWSGWPVDIRESYEVYGIILWDGNLHYLVVNRYQGVEQKPYLCPAELFEVTNSSLPQRWYFAFQGTEKKNDAIWGYEELVLAPKHLEDLQGRRKLTNISRKMNNTELYNS